MMKAKMDLAKRDLIIVFKVIDSIYCSEVRQEMNFGWVLK